MFPDMNTITCDQKDKWELSEGFKQLEKHSRQMDQLLERP